MIWVEGEEGIEIQVFVVKPHDFDPDEEVPADPQRPRRAAVAVARPLPRRLAGLSGQGLRCGVSRTRPDRPVSARTSSTPSPATGVAGSIDDLMKVTDALEELPYVDAERMGAMGWSYGGYMMMWFAGHTDRFEAIWPR